MEKDLCSREGAGFGNWDWKRGSNGGGKRTVARWGNCEEEKAAVKGKGFRHEMDLGGRISDLYAVHSVRSRSFSRMMLIIV